MPRLRVNTVYYFRYWNNHVDPNPALYVLFSDAQYTWGLNVHYLGQVWNQRGWRFKRLNFWQTRDQLLKYRLHPAFNKFFQWLESPAFSKMDGRTRYRTIKSRWPLMIEAMYRQYKTPLIQPGWSIQKDHLAELTDPQAWRKARRKAEDDWAAQQPGGGR